MYEGFISCLVVVWYLIMPHLRHVNVLMTLLRRLVRHVCMLLLFVRPHLRQACLGLHIAISLKDRTTRILSFGCGFAYVTAMGCAGFRLLFGINIVLKLLTIIK